MRILFASSEAIPYWKTGGLADVARTLPDALLRRGHDVWLIVPLYAALRRSIPLEKAGSATIDWPGGPRTARYFVHRPDSGAPAILVDLPGAFDVAEPYAEDPANPLEPGMRFALFCRAVVERARALEADVVHVNDWPTGLVPVYARIDGLDAPVVFGIHNMAYQGNFDPAILAAAGIPDSFFTVDDGLEFYGQASFLKAGLALADRLVTVSPTYAREIQTEEFGAGLHGLLEYRADRLQGILNGIDPDLWNPATDPAIPARYDAASIERKEIDRDALLHELDLDGRGPLFSIVSRLAHQKGIDLVIDAIPAMVRAGARLAALGTGDPAFEQALRDAAEQYPRRVAAVIGFDDARARRIYAGSDFLLMPSRFEPCGLGQMIAQRYGTVPVVRHTGGLVDTVVDAVTGFAFLTPTVDALLDAVARASVAWNGSGWRDLQRRCMALDWSWTRSAEEYEALYASVVSSANRPVRP